MPLVESESVRMGDVALPVQVMKISSVGMPVAADVRSMTVLRSVSSTRFRSNETIATREWSSPRTRHLVIRSSSIS